MIAIFDMNAFYASCELVFRPDIVNKRVVVCSSGDGVIIACTPQAMQVGVEKFYPLFKQREIIQKFNVSVFSSNFAMYGLISSRIMQILAEESPLIEVYSIDEAFVFLDGIKDKVSFCKHLKDRVWREQRIGLGVGVSKNKTLAKLANRASKKYAKLNGICILDEPHKWRWLQERLPVDKTWGVGSGLTKKLAKINVHTIADLADLSLRRARDAGGVLLAKTVQELNGEMCFEISDESPDKQQIITSRTFGGKIYELNELQSAASTFANMAVGKLRKQSSTAGVLSVWIQSSRHEDNFYFNSSQWIFDPATSDARIIASRAVDLVRRLYIPDIAYKKVGVALSKIENESVSQNDFFYSTERDEATSTVIDSINAKFGKTTVQPARQLAQSWMPKRKLLSPSYLTSWDDIPEVKT